MFVNKKELEKLPEEIEKFEEECSALEEALRDPFGLGLLQVKSHEERLREKRDKLARKEKRWEKLLDELSRGTAVLLQG